MISGAQKQWYFTIHAQGIFCHKFYPKPIIVFSNWFFYHLCIWYISTCTWVESTIKRKAWSNILNYLPEFCRFQKSRGGGTFWSEAQSVREQVKSLGSTGQLKLLGRRPPITGLLSRWENQLPESKHIMLPCKQPHLSNKKVLFTSIINPLTTLIECLRPH